MRSSNSAGCARKIFDNMSKCNIKPEARLTKGILRMSGRITKRLNSLEKSVVSQVSNMSPTEVLDLYVATTTTLTNSIGAVTSIRNAQKVK